MRILFMGTPDFALFSLRALVESGENVIGVVTQPDKPQGRGYALTPPPVKVYAQEQSIPVYQPATLRDDGFYELLQNLNPDLIVVTAYGKILPARVLEYPRLGCVNVHGSLLPAYRGAAPMQRAIIDGKTVTGITTMMMDVGLDTGDMLLTGEVEITPTDNFETIHDKMGDCSREVLLRTVKAIREGNAVRIPQDHSLATYAAKIEKSDCKLDFHRSAEELHNLIRGLSPVPLSFTNTPDGKLLKVVAAEVAQSEGTLGEAGEVLSLDGGKVTVACGVGAISLLAVQPEGKKRMAASDWINGRKIQKGDRLVTR
ncbi:MAG: methionyl-tRNA formyltransferase [Ruminococcaceae bacterium]|nr:methionyl-tRNA formyltransferase [Oscillospiraceae bacterium]